MENRLIIKIDNYNLVLKNIFENKISPSEIDNRNIYFKKFYINNLNLEFYLVSKISSFYKNKEGRIFLKKDVKKKFSNGNSLALVDLINFNIAIGRVNSTINLNILNQQLKVYGLTIDESFQTNEPL